MFARFFVLLVYVGFFPAVQAQTRDCSVTGFKPLGNSNGESPLYPVDPECYPKFNKSFYSYTASTGGWFLQQVLGYDLGNNKMAALKQYFGQLVYLADNRLFYNNLPADTKNLEGSQNIIPACKQKDNQYAHLTFWYNENTHVLKVRFSVAVPYHYAQAVAGKSLSSLDKIKAGLMNVFNPKWLTMALGRTVWPAPQSCFVSAMQQLERPGASVSCGSAGSMTKADEAKEVQAEEEAERKLQAKGPIKGPIKIQAKGAVKVKGGGVSGNPKKTLGGR